MSLWSYKKWKTFLNVIKVNIHEYAVMAIKYFDFSNDF